MFRSIDFCCFFNLAAILNFFQGHFPKKLSQKVNSQKRHYLKKRIFILF
jgi:hypothetical protein